MNNIQKRFLLFIIGCILTRTVIILIAKNYQEYLPIMGYISLIPAIGFLTIYLTGSRTSGSEVFGDKIWWNNLRPVHGILYLTFGVMAINSNSNAWLILLADLIIGTSGFAIHHYNEHNFSKLLG
jgi:hypothetical protein